MTNELDGNWYEPDDAADDETSAYPVAEYDVVASPNDFNILTIFSFISSGTVKIPSFQRNYVWDIGKASKFIESVLIGLPIPQIFLYEKAPNRFLVIDGQQRLMSVYYFMNGRFPRREKSADLRRIFDEQGGIPASLLEDDRYFFLRSFSI